MQYVRLLKICLLWVPLQLFAQEESSALRDSAKIWYSIGKDYLIKSRADDAIRNFYRALDYDSTFIDVYLDLARAFIVKNSFDSAAMVYYKIISLNPEDSRPWQGLGYMYGIVKGDYEKGLEFYRKAVEIDAKNNDARFGMANLLEKIGRVEAADSVYKETLANDSQNPSILRAYGLFLAKQGTQDETAFKYLEMALPHFLTDRDTRESLVNVTLRLGAKNKLFYEKTLTHLNSLLASDSADYTLFMQRGDIYMGQKKHKEALADYDRAIRLSPPDNPIPYLRKITLLIEKNAFSEARKIIEEVLALSFNSDELKAATYDLLGDSYFYEAEGRRREGDRLRKDDQEEKARENYKRAVELYDKGEEPYKDAMTLNGNKWVEYAQKQLQRIGTLRKKTWRKYLGIE